MSTTKTEYCPNELGVNAYLVALTPSAVCPLLAHEEVTCPASRLACLICFADKGKAFQGKHRCISKANTPGTHPTAFR